MRKLFEKIRRRIGVLAICAIILTLLSQETFAFYSVIGKATNVVTSGDVQLAIHEMTDQRTAFPTEGVYIVPGDIVSKQVSIENVCNHPFYLRVKVIYGVDSQELSAEDCFKLNIDTENWLLHEGWYYYKGIVSPGQTTPNVFSHVEIVGSKVDNSYIGKTLTLTVRAQAVQSENNPVDDMQTHMASGWPKE